MRELLTQRAKNKPVEVEGFKMFSTNVKNKPNRRPNDFPLSSLPPPSPFLPFLLKFVP